jgi:WYL_2, Sm-like SH3 beta-barrel fold
MSNTITKDEIQTFLRENITSVLFQKKDGTQRAMLCTLKADVLPPYERKEGEPAKKKSDESLAVWDLEKESWRSFRIDSLISYSAAA